MKLHFSKREQQRMVLVAILAVFVLWVYGHSLNKITARSRALGLEVRSARDTLRTIEQALANEEQVRSHHEQLEQTVKSLRSLLPPEKEQNVVIERLSNLASQTQVKIQTIFPQRGSGEAELAALLHEGQVKRPIYKTIPIQIDAIAGYHELGSFLSLIETSTSPMEVASLRIAASSTQIKRHNVKLVLNVFFAASDTEPLKPAAVGSPQGGS
jgi:Tfp pilus assembly protein PilO